MLPDNDPAGDNVAILVKYDNGFEVASCRTQAGESAVLADRAHAPAAPSCCQCLQAPPDGPHDPSQLLALVR